MNQIDLEGRVAVITGGAQGIGFAAAERMLKSGASVALWDIDAARLAEAEKTLAVLGNVSSTTVELTDEAWSTTPASPAATAPPGNWTRPSGAAWSRST
jgi:2-dehydro-3-deoxy-L-rhamnonate dehydrogenase (NAD+)